MNRNGIWLIDEDEITSLFSEYDQAMSRNDDSVRSVPEVVQEYDGFNVMRIHGALMARSNRFTDYFGMSTTDNLMKTFDELLAQDDKPILLDIDGPGAEAKLIFEFADMIYSAGDRVTSYTSGTAASGHMVLYQAAQGGRYAHESALIGSVGVLGYYMRDKDDYGIVTSKNADNKYPSKKSVKKRIDGIEALFTERLSLYTGKSIDDVVKSGDNGALFTGKVALDEDFVDVLTDYQTMLGQIMAKDKVENAGENNDSVTEAVSAAVSARDARWEKLMAHPKAAANMGAVSHYAKLPISDEDAVKSLDLIPDAQVKDAPAGDDNPDDSTSEKVSTEDMTKAATEAAVAAVSKLYAGANPTIPHGDGDEPEGGGDDDETKEPTDEERAEKAAERRYGKNK